MVQTDKTPFASSWVMVGTGVITLALAYSTWYSFSVFFVALLKEFNWSRSTGAGAFSLFVIVHGIISPFVGGVLDRFGPKKIFILGSILIGMGLMACSRIDSWWEFYIYFGLLTAIGVGSTGWVPNTTLIQQWFKEHRGLAMGIISSGVGIGIFICVPAIQFLITRFGWRVAYAIIAFAIPLTIILLALILIREPPARDSFVCPINSSKDSFQRGERARQSWKIRQVIGKKQFQLLCLSFFFSSVSIHAILTHQVAFLVDQGLGALFASYIVGLLGLVSIGAKILWGVLSDRIGREVTYTMGISCAVLGILVLLIYPSSPSAYLPYAYALFFGLGYAVMASLPPLITADFFEGPSFGAIFGMIQFVNGLGSAVGAWFAGFIYDQAGSYVPVFVTMIGCILFACFNIWKVSPRKARAAKEKTLK